ncbi:MAG: discoidin domain-containing protein [Luteolibacter sp.]|uniref:discoidin domain-containing protein n=1 Tax=Luteolibacter sp. TaxID=1962973 RepID=UPI0032642666
MTADYNPNRLDELLQHLFDETMDDSSIDELNSILRGSREARGHYRKSLRIHAALIRHRRVENVVSIESVRPTRRIWLGSSSLAAAACVVIGIGLYSNSHRAPAATLTGTTAAEWKDNAGSGLLDRPMDLVRGFAEVSYRNGVRVILEGPCRFEITSETSMTVSHGRATVKVPHKLKGFHLDTPAGRITDLGTEFGVAVGSGVEGPVILTEVFSGEIEIPAEETPRKRLLSGDSLAIVRETGGTRLISTLGDYRVDLADSARHLPTTSGPSPLAGNLALGKPVSSPAFYSMPHGSLFPPQTLTDGRLNDSGSPGDWSFWLSPNETDGEFTVDLLEKTEIGRIDLQNTRNRTHGDRGTRGFRILVSDDGGDFREIVHGRLQRIAELPSPGVDFPFESFPFAPVTARFVKVVVDSHYRLPERPLDNPNHGGGLNEIRIFAP